MIRLLVVLLIIFSRMVSMVLVPWAVGPIRQVKYRQGYTPGP